MKTLAQLKRNTEQWSKIPHTKIDKKTGKKVVYNDDIVGRAMETNAAVIKVSSSRQRGVDTMVFVVRCRAHTESVYYDVVIELLPGEVHKDVFKMPSEQSPCWVKCSCPFFLFKCEYALARVGSSEIDYSNGKKPIITNPKQFPILCKHLYRATDAVLKAAIQQAKNDSRKYNFEK